MHQAHEEILLALTPLPRQKIDDTAQESGDHKANEASATYGVDTLALRNSLRRLCCLPVTLATLRVCVGLGACVKALRKADAPIRLSALHPSKFSQQSAASRDGEEKKACGELKEPDEVERGHRRRRRTDEDTLSVSNDEMVAHGDPVVASLAASLVMKWRRLTLDSAPLPARKPSVRGGGGGGDGGRSSYSAGGSPEVDDHTAICRGGAWFPDDTLTRLMRERSIELIRSALSRPLPDTSGEEGTLSASSRLPSDEVAVANKPQVAAQKGPHQKRERHCLVDGAAHAKCVAAAAREVELEVFESFLVLRDQGMMVAVTNDRTGMKGGSREVEPEISDESNYLLPRVFFDEGGYRTKLRRLAFNLGNRGDGTLRASVLRACTTGEMGEQNQNRQDSRDEGVAGEDEWLCVTPARLAAMTIDELASASLRLKRQAYVAAARDAQNSAAVVHRALSGLQTTTAHTCPCCGEGVSCLGQTRGDTQEDSFISASAARSFVECKRCYHRFALD